jgi:DNA-binding PadR family transcriptional regulator
MSATHAIEAWPYARRWSAKRAQSWPHAKRRGAKRALGAALFAAMAAKGGRGERHRGEGRGGRKGGGRHYGRGPGFGPFMAGFGGPPFGPPGGPIFFRRGPKARRGDVRTAALLLLAEEPRNGYQIMQEIEERSEGFWRPSPGSVYPALQQLEDEGLVREVGTEGRKLYELTDAGRTYVDERGEDLTPPWEEMTGDVSDETVEAGAVMRSVGLAFMQVMHAGSDAQIAEATKALTETRRRLYGILAEDEPSEGDE